MLLESRELEEPPWRRGVTVPPLLQRVSLSRIARRAVNGRDLGDLASLLRSGFNPTVVKNSRRTYVDNETHGKLNEKCFNTTQQYTCYITVT